ncbi:MAG: hypothetical protein IK029_00330, partial [Oscillospiraceae bacterium]|nr:hypothetical protein [Oscillospiraceae bacterium]
TYSAEIPSRTAATSRFFAYLYSLRAKKRTQLLYEKNASQAITAAAIIVTNYYNRCFCLPEALRNVVLCHFEAKVSTSAKGRINRPFPI